MIYLGFEFPFPISTSRIEVPGKGIHSFTHSFPLSDILGHCLHLKGQSWAPASVFQLTGKSKEEGGDQSTSFQA